MREQTAILAQDHGEWIFVVDSDDDEPERTWKDIDEAFEELRREGWEVVQGPAPTRSSFAELGELDRFAPWGYRLKRVTQQPWFKERINRVRIWSLRNDRRSQQRIRKLSPEGKTTGEKH